MAKLALINREQKRRDTVKKFAAKRAELEAKGVEFAGETLDSGVCQMAFFADPDGNELTLHRRYAPYTDGTQT